MRFTGRSKYGLPKNIQCVMRTRVWTVLSDWYSWKFLDYRSSLKKNTYKIGLILILIWYARKVLFSGVFYISSIFQDGGMVMDENGRNGGNWYLAQQITYHVTLYIFQQITHHVIMRILSITTTNIPCNQTTYFINKSHNL